MDVHRAGNTEGLCFQARQTVIETVGVDPTVDQFKEILDSGSNRLTSY